VTEDEAGRLISFEHKMTQGPLRQVSEGRVTDGKLTVTQGTARTTRTIDAPGGLCNWAQRRLRMEKGYAAGTQYAFDAFVPEFPDRTIGIAVKVGAKEPVEVFDVTKWLHRLDTEMSIMPGVPSSEWVDEGGTTWLTRTTLGPGMTIETRKVGKEFALSPDDPADLLAASFVQPDRPISRPRALRKLQMMMRPVAGEASRLAVPEGPFQQVEARDGGLLLTMHQAVGRTKLSYALPYAGEEHAALLQANKWLEIDEPIIREMAAKAVGSETDALRAARRIEKYVRGAIRDKGLGLGMATAAETARQRAGDCTEHAVLAAALARASGMPSRVVGGLVYAEALPGLEGGGFGYHMWTEVWVGEWLPLDAALGEHDATHVAIARDDLNGMSDLLEMATAISRFLGNVRIEVLDTDW